MFEPFTLPFVQQGLIEVLLLSIAAGLVGTWVVLRGLSFYAHAIGTAAFPGLVIADGLGFLPALGAFGATAAFSILNAIVGRSRRSGTDSVTALVLVACLAVGVILASDVFHSGSDLDTLLFGSLLLIGKGDIALAAGAAVVAICASRLFQARWLARGFDPGSAAGLRSGSAWLDVALLGTVALTATAALTAVGALLISALIVVPAATVRMLTRRLATLQLGTIALVSAEAVCGLWLSVKTDAPPGATIAVISGAVFALVAIGRRLGQTRIRFGAIAAVGAALLLAGCGGPGDGGDDGRVQVTATTTQIADFVREVGGGRVDVSQVLQPNTDPHEYEPRPSDVAAATDAAIVFRNGGLDDWAQSLVDKSGSDAEVIDLGAKVPVRLRGQDAEPGSGGPGELDPHWWHDPRNAEAATVAIERALIRVDPGHRRDYESSADRYLARLKSLDRGIRACVARVPAGERRMVTDHDAFDYFAHRYGIEVVGAVIPALTTEAQPSAGDLAELEKVIERERVKAIFPEASVSKKLAEAVASDTGATADHTLYGDTLGPEGSKGATYIGMEESNADQLVRGMTGGRERCELGSRG